MRRHLAASTALAGLVLAAGGLLTACGQDDGSAAEEPTTSAASSDPGDPSDSGTPSATASAKPVGVQKTCSELYHPPAQLMPRAIELLHGSPSAEDASGADEIAAGLAEVEGHSLGPLAEDIAVVRQGVEDERSAGGAAEVKSFDAAANRLARHCALYND